MINNEEDCMEFIRYLFDHGFNRNGIIARNSDNLTPLSLMINNADLEYASQATRVINMVKIIIDAYTNMGNKYIDWKGDVI